jgi:hypothetical protein
MSPLPFDLPQHALELLEHRVAERVDALARHVERENEDPVLRRRVPRGTYERVRISNWLSVPAP